MAAAEPLAFGVHLRRYRVEAGLTQEELAERARLSAEAVSDLERGVNREPTVDMIGQLTHALELSDDDRAVLLEAVRHPPASAETTAADAIPLPDEDAVRVRTFLIADARGYTRFTLEQGDEAAARFTARLAALAQEGVEARGGSVVEVRGDEVLAVFASARQALRAAVELQTRFAREMRDDPSLPLKVGIGLDAGEAVPLEGGYRGGALNLAARLCSLAGPGEVLASGVLASLAGKTAGLEYLERGMMQLKGLIEPVRVVQVVATDAGPELSAEMRQPSALESVSAPEAPEARDLQRFPIGGFLGSLPVGPLVARDEELAQVLQAIDAVNEGTGRLVLLAGEPGAGKTRLAQEAMLAARNRDFVVGAGICYEPQETLPFYPFLDALAMIYAVAPVSVRGLVPSRWRYLGRLLPEAAISMLPAGSDSQEEQQRLFRAVTGFVQAIAATIPVALLLDDLQWADSATLELLQHLARHTRAHRVFLLGTYRNVEVGRQHPLERVLLDLRREHLLERVAVQPLPERGTAALMTATLGGPEVSEELSRLVHRHTEGNAFFTQEVVRSLIERGDLSRESGGWRQRSIAEIEVPEGVRAVIGQRLSRLSEPAPAVLHEASILGQTFGFDDLQAMTGRTEDELEEALEEARVAALIREEANRHRFNHALTHQTLYEEIPPRRRRRLHRAAGEALERLPAGLRQKRAAELAWHFREAEDTVRALRYALLAGEQAEAVFAYHEAEGHYRAALDLSRQVEDREQEAAALEKLGTVLGATGRLDEAADMLERAADGYYSLSNLHGEARAVAEIGRLNFERGSVDESIDRVQSMLKRLESMGPSALLGKLYLAQVQYLRSKMRLTEMLSSAERALDIARAVGEETLLVTALHLTGTAKVELGQHEEGIRLLEEAVAVAEATGDLLRWHLAELNLGEQYWACGLLEKAIPYLERAYEIAAQMENHGQMAYSRAIVGTVRFYRGEWERACYEYERALALVPPGSHSWGSWAASYLLGFLCVVEGRWKEAEIHLGQGLAIAAKSDDVRQRCYVLDALAELELLRGDPQRALRYLQPVRQYRTRPLAPALSALGFALLEVGEVEEAAAIAARTLDLATLGNYGAQLPEVLELCGAVMTHQGRWEEAVHHLEEGLSQARSVGTPFYEARLLYRYGLMHGQKREPEQARERLEEALVVFQQLGAHPYRERTEQALALLQRG